MTLVSVMTPCFRSEAYLEGYFDAVLTQSALDRLEVVLVLNEPSAEEMAIVERFREAHPGIVRPIVFPEGWDTKDAESRGARSQALVSESWNRAVAAARGEYLAHWDMDDIRTPDSIEAQLRTLVDNPHALMTYGDMVVVGHYGDRDGELVVAPEFDRELFMSGCPGGTFRLWRRDAVQVVGPFDEQLKSGADFDLYVRVTANGDMVRTPQVLGYYLNAGGGLSTAGDDVQPTERTVIEMRYGILDKVDRRYLAAASRYRIGELRFGDDWLPVDSFVPDLQDRLDRAAADPRLLPKPKPGHRIAGRAKSVAQRVRSALGLGGGRQ